jgi:putative membrane protein
MPFEDFTPPKALETLGQGVKVFEGRLHPLTLVIGLTKYGRALVPAVALVMFGNRWAGAPLLFFTLMGLVATFTKYFFFSYRIENGELITQEGLIEKRQRNIPLERIQEISIEQGVLHRLLGVVDAKIETGSGSGAEASLSVLSRAEAEKLRQIVFAHAEAIRAGKASPEEVETVEAIAIEPESVVIRRLSVKELVVAGLTSNHLLSALALAGAAWNFADDLLPNAIYAKTGKLISEEARHLAAQGIEWAVVVTVAGIFAIVLIGILFSVIGSVALFYGFTFSRRGDDLQRRYGLLTQRSSSLPRRRIQVLEIEEKALRRLFGWATLRADTSGRGREDSDDNKGRDVLLPIVRAREVDELLPGFFPDFVADNSEWRRASDRTVRRETAEAAVICLIAAIALFIWLGNWIALLPLLIVPMFYLAQAVSYRHLGYALGGNYLRTRRGWLGRSTHIVPINKIQAVEVHQTPFDRWWGMATLTVDTAGQAFTGGGPEISNLPIAEARELARLLAKRAAVTEYKW